MQRKITLLVAIMVFGIAQLQAKAHFEKSQDSVDVYIKRGKAFYGAAVKWAVAVVDAKKYNELNALKADKYLRENRKAKIFQNQYVKLRIAAGSEQLIYVGNSYFYVTASPGSTLEILVKGINAEVGICEGTAEVGIGFFSTDILLFANSYEEFALDNVESCANQIPNLITFKEVTL